MVMYGFPFGWRSVSCRKRCRGIAWTMRTRRGYGRKWYRKIHPPRFGIERFCYTGTALQLIAWALALFLSDTYIGLVLAIMLVDVGAQCQQLSNQSGCLAMVPEATNRCNTVFMSHLFAGGSLGTLSAGMAWNYGGWTYVCFVGVGFALSALAVTVVFNSRKDARQ